jgi:precorrin-6Y C5,15-methyltransferase (decarboxylating)
MCEILLFAGTAEGRRIAEYLQENRKSARVFVATEYGESLLESTPEVRIECGRLGEPQMEALFRNCPGALIIDATHPYASEVTENIRKACAAAGLRYLRVLRRSTPEGKKQAVFVRSPEEAAEFLASCKGNVLLTTGSKELKAFTSVPEYRNRFYARVLSVPGVVAECAELGFQGSHLICMQGPFSVEMNCALIHQTNAAYLVTKDTGAAGGFPEKAEAAEKCGCRLVIIGRPVQEDGVTLEECLRLLGGDSASAADAWGKRDNGTGPDPQPEQEIALVGIGMGGKDGRTMTIEAEKYCREADLLIGAGRMLRAVSCGERKTLEEYRPEKIAGYLSCHPECRRVAVLLSGDVGFYSGAKKLLSVLPEKTRLIPGIGSLVYFCSRLKTSWEDVTVTSSHGRKSNLTGLCLKNPKVFSLLGGRDSVRELCRKFAEYGMNSLKVHVGENLSYPDERICSGAPEDFLDYEGQALSVVLIENPTPDRTVTHGIPDEWFLRDKVPMTKEEVREISLGKLRLEKDSVIYDVGAGSGSVSVEMALQALEGQVYAIEKNPAAVALLQANRRKFRADNLSIIEGLAPEAMEELPVPTHAFIGGSSGNLREILELLLKKNPGVRVVINAITLETVAEALDALEKLSFGEADIVCVSAAKARKAGRYHMMMGQNPVYVITTEGGRQ